jgi:imidazole glycerol phosphate synthase subunit HisF
MVKAAGLDLTLRDITGPVQVPVVACASPGQPALYGAGEHRAQAVAEALTGALFHYQLRRDPALKAAVGAAAPPIWTNPAGPAATGRSPERVENRRADVTSR